MNNKTHNKVLLRVLVALLAATLLFGIFAAPQAEASSYKASYIDLMENAPKLDLEKYLDSDVVSKLPSNVKDDQEISVIVTLDVEDLLDAYEKTDKSVSFGEFALQSDNAKNIENAISEKKEEVLNKLDELAIGYEVGDDYTVLMTGFELVIQAGDFDAVRKSLDKTVDIMVCEVYQVAETQLVENKVNVYDTGIIDSSMVKYDGTGMVGAVLDTGIDYAHSAFSTENFLADRSKLGLTKDQVLQVLNQTVASQQYKGLTIDDVYWSEKIPFMFDYSDQDPDAYSTHNHHGTHVSGIICGRDDTITGVAPNAQLVSMKVFSDIQDSARTSWILSALEDCVILGVDAINMSLGTSCGFSRPTDEYAVSGVFDKIREAGIGLIVAANNDNHAAMQSEKNGNLPLTSNPDVGTVGSPATLGAALSVASIMGVKTPYIKYGETIMYFNESNTNAGEENKFFEFLLGDKQAQDFEYVVIPGVGRTADYTGMDVKGKIALVRRGDTTFEEKAITAQMQGAVGIIIYNNVAGDIRMNSGDATLAMCSINQDDGELLAAAGGGILTINKDQVSGPFMNDFSSWGPTPDLHIKPEITQHGGEILSAVTGGDYDRLSGTSMACPNLCGLALLLRQYVSENFPEIADNHVEVTNMVNRLMMSTADIMINKNGQPYAVRKQGAGLANLLDSINTKAVILTYDENGEAMNTSKLELGDDKAKTGVYEMTFGIKNFGTTALSYDMSAYVLTEGVSKTLTSHGQTTVTQEAYPLEGAVLEIVRIEGGSNNGMNVTVNGGSTANVTVKITLSDADKKYMNDSFENGMFVEGFITLKATAGTDIDMSVPYLAFYGDWTQAPLLDLDYFQTDEDDRNESLLPEDKTMADLWATIPLGAIDDEYMSYLGSFYFFQDPKNIVIAADKEHVALSNTDGSVHILKYIYAGMLRSAATVRITITDDATGEVIFERIEECIRKGYHARPSLVEVEFDAAEYNLKNNSRYTVRMETLLDYEDGGKDTNKNNVFEFPFTVDFQAPAVTDVEFRYEYDKTLKRNRLYADVSVYDNHFAQALQLGYVSMKTNADGQNAVTMNVFSNYVTPVYSQRNGTTVVTLELTDYIEELRSCYSNNNHVAFTLTAYDYAMNAATYEIGLPYNYMDFFVDGLTENTLVLSPNEIYSILPSVYPDTEWAEVLKIESMHPKTAGVVNNKIIARQSGTAVIKISDPRDPSNWKTFNVKVLAEGDEGYKKYDKPVVDTFTITGYDTLKAYYFVNSSDREIGQTGDTRYFTDGYGLSLYPSESVKLNLELSAYFPDDVKLEFTAGNSDIVTIDQNGVVTAQAEGFSSVTVKILMKDASGEYKATFYTQTISISVKDPYVVLGGMLQNYYGQGGIVMIPERLKLSSIGTFAFTNYTWEPKTPEELAHVDEPDTIQRPIGDDTITKVVIPEGVETIYAYAFAKLTALEEVVLPSTLTHIDQNAFDGCTNLKKITFSGENNLKIINFGAFRNCDLQGDLDLPSAYVVADYAFAGNEDLTSISLPDTLQSIGAYAFEDCEKLSQVDIAAKVVKFGVYAFKGCASLTKFDVNTSLIPAGMFYMCKNLTEVTIGPDVNSINEFAFNGTNISNYVVLEGNTAFKVQNEDYIVSADGTQLIAVAPNVRGKITAADFGDNTITSIGRGAFSHNLKITSISLPDVTYVGAYAFGYYDETQPNTRSSVASVTLGKLTYIGEYAFYGTQITEMPNFDANTVVERYAFGRSSVASVVIPDGMNVPDGMFAECMFLTSVTLGNDVTVGEFAFITNRNHNLRAVQVTIGNKTGYKFVFASSIVKVEIGNNVVLGKGAFQNAASLKSVTLGENAEIGEQAFYNCEALVNIDLSKAKSIGTRAFSGDTYYICADNTMNMENPLVVNNMYQFQFVSPAMASVDLSSAESVGSYAFAFCPNLTSVVLSENIVELPEYAFYRCQKLAEINLSNVQTIGGYALAETVLTTADLSSATSIGEYAFANAKSLAELTLNPNGSVLDMGAFINAEALSKVENLQAVTEIGAYAFANSILTEADLSAAVKIGDLAFMKKEVAPLTVKLGTALAELGDNPFAYCVVAPFFTTETVTFNGQEYTKQNFTYQISETVCVIDGNLYCKLPNGGLEMSTYTGNSDENVRIAEGTYRVSAYAFAGTGVKMVTVPYTVLTIGNKAFFDCENLQVVVFTSYEAPILEEEFDQSYYNTLQNFPGTGDMGELKDYDGNPIVITPLEILPYFMWNILGNYSNVYYGANFVDYIGHMDNKIMMVRPSNGQHYGTFVHEQYFNLFVDGSVAAQDATLAAIAAINQIPERVELIHEEIVKAARAAYTKVATLDQQALVSNFSKLQKAEQRLTQLKAAEKKCACGQDCGCTAGCVCGETCCENCGCMTPNVEPPAPVNGWMIVAIVALCLVAIAGIVIAVLMVRMRKTDDVVETIPAAEAAAEVEAPAETEATTETETE